MNRAKEALVRITYHTKRAANTKKTRAVLKKIKKNNRDECFDLISPLGKLEDMESEIREDEVDLTGLHLAIIDSPIGKYWYFLFVL